MGNNSSGTGNIRNSAVNNTSTNEINQIENLPERNNNNINTIPLLKVPYKNIESLRMITPDMNKKGPIFGVPLFIYNLNEFITTESKSILRLSGSSITETDKIVGSKTRVVSAESHSYAFNIFIKGNESRCTIQINVEYNKDTRIFTITFTHKRGNIQYVRNLHDVLKKYLIDFGNGMAIKEDKRKADLKAARGGRHKSRTRRKRSLRRTRRGGADNNNSNNGNPNNGKYTAAGIKRMTRHVQNIIAEDAAEEARRHAERQQMARNRLARKIAKKARPLTNSVRNFFSH
jgi:hypothetical protein